MRYIFMLIATVLVLTASQAQVNFQIHANIGTQPVWGPVGYDQVQYYYFPDIEVYYNVPLHRFYYNEGNRWVGRTRLPARYREYDLYNSYKVVVNDRQPYRRHNVYRDQYVSFKGRHDQQTIRDSREEKYFVNKNHPEHANWMKHQRHGNGKGNGQGNNGRGQDKRGNNQK